MAPIENTNWSKFLCRVQILSPPPLIVPLSRRKAKLKKTHIISSCNSCKEINHKVISEYLNYKCTRKEKRMSPLLGYYTIQECSSREFIILCKHVMLQAKKLNATLKQFSFFLLLSLYLELYLLPLPARNGDHRLGFVAVPSTCRCMATTGSLHLEHLNEWAAMHRVRRQ